MAKRHVVQYFLEMEHQYLEMLDNIKDFKELVAEGKISQEDLNQALAEVERIKANYERIAYIMFELNKPNKKDKKIDRTTLSWYNTLKYASKEALLDENRDALCKIKELLREGKLKNGQE